MIMVKKKKSPKVSTREQLECQITTIITIENRAQQTRVSKIKDGVRRGPQPGEACHSLDQLMSWNQKRQNYNPVVMRHSV